MLRTDAMPAITAPGVSACSYWMPRHFPISAWYQHAPFAFWLVDALRPREIAELGSHNGFSLFVFAEAVKRLGLPTRILALDSWEGDEQAGFYGEDVFAAVSTTVAEDYPESIQLLRGYFSDSAALVAEGTVDLLHIDGRHGYDDVREDFDTYVGKLSDRGVVIFHDIAEAREGFGVHRLWAELEGRYPAFGFRHGHGLGVLAVGSKVPQSVLAFIRAANAAPEVYERFYARLGERIARQRVLEVDHFEVIHETRLRVMTLERRVEELAADRDRAERDAATVRSSASWRLTAPIRSVMSVFARARGEHR